MRYHGKGSLGLRYRNFSYQFHMCYDVASVHAWCWTFGDEDKGCLLFTDVPKGKIDFCTHKFVDLIIIMFSVLENKLSSTRRRNCRKRYELDV